MKDSWVRAMVSADGRWLLVFLLVASSVPAVAEDGKAAEADSEFLEFLGSMGEDADEWEEFMDIAADDSGPLMAEAENE